MGMNDSMDKWLFLENVKTSNYALHRIIKVDDLLKTDDLCVCTDWYFPSILFDKKQKRKIDREWSFVNENASAEFDELGMHLNNFEQLAKEVYIPS